MIAIAIRKISLLLIGVDYAQFERVQNAERA
jgi:hypothetical protein